MGKCRGCVDDANCQQTYLWHNGCMDQKKILIVDDEEYFRDIFGTKLRSEGFAIETATDANEAFSKAASWLPDLILMDVQMPGLSGISAVMKMKENPDLKNIKVVFLTNLGGATSDASSLNDKYAKDIGAEGYIKKTDDLDFVVRRIREILV